MWRLGSQTLVTKSEQFKTLLSRSEQNIQAGGISWHIIRPKFPQGSMKWRLSYSPEHLGIGNSQILVIKDQNYEDEKGWEKMWAEFLVLY